MFSKILIATALIGSIFFTANAEAYDLPKIYPDKENKTAPIGISDWTSFEKFEQKIKSLLDENENLPASSKERINNDKNLVFIAFYKGNAYFLDRYSIEVKKNNSDKKSWKQHIFPIGRGISPKNSSYTMQRFCLQDGEIYNSLRRSNKISAVENSNDKKFLKECFKVGYYYAFKKEFNE
jgi:hypothetical protein